MGPVKIGIGFVQIFKALRGYGRIFFLMRRLFLVFLVVSLCNVSQSQAETWECSVTEGWSGNLKKIVFFRESDSFKTNTVVSEHYRIIYESDREIHLYRNELGSVMTAITLFKDTSEILGLTFYPPSKGRERFGSGGACLVRYRASEN